MVRASLHQLVDSLAQNTLSSPKSAVFLFLCNARSKLIVFSEFELVALLIFELVE